MSIGVFGPNHQQPFTKLSYCDAKQLVLQGIAQWTNRCKAIRLKTFNPVVRGRSCKVDERLIIEYVLGAEEAKAIIDGWRRNMAIAEIQGLAMRSSKVELAAFPEDIHI